MKKWLFLGILAPALLWGASMPIETLLERAATEKKVGLVFIESDYCPWCKRMKESTFENRLVKTKLETELVVGFYNKERDTLPNHLSARHVPTIHLVDGEGRVLLTVFGYEPPGPFIKHIEAAQAKLLAQ